MCLLSTGGKIPFSKPLKWLEDFSLNRGGQRDAKIEEMPGAGCRDRTRDPLITNQVLYQLS
jgi:hypothetical protein